MAFSMLCFSLLLLTLSHAVSFSGRYANTSISIKPFSVSELSYSTPGITASVSASSSPGSAYSAQLVPTSSLQHYSSIIPSSASTFTTTKAAPRSSYMSSPSSYSSITGVFSVSFQSSSALNSSKDLLSTYSSQFLIPVIDSASSHSLTASSSGGIFTTNASNTTAPVTTAFNTTTPKTTVSTTASNTTTSITPASITTSSNTAAPVATSSNTTAPVTTPFNTTAPSTTFNTTPFNITPPSTTAPNNTAPSTASNTTASYLPGGSSLATYSISPSTSIGNSSIGNSVTLSAVTPNSSSGIASYISIVSHNSQSSSSNSSLKAHPSFSSVQSGARSSVRSPLTTNIRTSTSSSNLTWSYITTIRDLTTSSHSDANISFPASYTTPTYVPTTATTTPPNLTDAVLTKVIKELTTSCTTESSASLNGTIAVTELVATMTITDCTFTRTNATAPWSMASDARSTAVSFPPKSTHSNASRASTSSAQVASLGYSSTLTLTKYPTTAVQSHIFTNKSINPTTIMSQSGSEGPFTSSLSNSSSNASDIVTTVVSEFQTVCTVKQTTVSNSQTLAYDKVVTSTITDCPCTLARPFSHASWSLIAHNATGTGTALSSTSSSPPPHQPSTNSPRPAATAGVTISSKSIATFTSSGSASAVGTMVSNPASATFTFAISSTIASVIPSSNGVSKAWSSYPTKYFSSSQFTSILTTVVSSFEAIHFSTHATVSNGQTLTINDTLTTTVTNCPCTLTRSCISERWSLATSAASDVTSTPPPQSNGTPTSTASLTSSAFANQPSQLSAASTAIISGEYPEILTTVVSEFETVTSCQRTSTLNGHTFTYSTVETSTIVDCPCTLTKSCSSAPWSLIGPTSSASSTSLHTVSATPATETSKLQYPSVIPTESNVINSVTLVLSSSNGPEVPNIPTTQLSTGSGSFGPPASTSAPSRITSLVKPIVSSSSFSLETDSENAVSKASGSSTSSFISTTTSHESFISTPVSRVTASQKTPAMTTVAYSLTRSLGKSDAGPPTPSLSLVTVSCSGPTTLVIGSSSYTATAATTFTITNCDCSKDSRVSFLTANSSPPGTNGVIPVTSYDGATPATASIAEPTTVKLDSTSTNTQSPGEENTLTDATTTEFTEVSRTVFATASSPGITAITLSSASSSASDPSSMPPLLATNAAKKLGPSPGLKTSLTLMCLFLYPAILIILD